MLFHELTDDTVQSFLRVYRIARLCVRGAEYLRHLGEEG